MGDPKSTTAAANTKTAQFKKEKETKKLTGKELRE